MKRAIWVFIFVFLATFTLFTKDPYKLFEQANDYFRKGDYDKAIELYQEILSNGFVAKEVYFNLGNAYFRQQQYHLAILNYERAKLLDPSDPDVDYNLKLANSFIVDKFDTVPKFFLVQWWEALRDSLNSSGWAVVSLIFVWGAFVSFTIFLLSKSVSWKKVALPIGVFLLILFVGTSLVTASRYSFETSSKQAIILAASCYVKSSPEMNSKDLFIVHQGTKVEILDRIGDWLKVKFPNGNIGWLEIKDLEEI